MLRNTEQGFFQNLFSDIFPLHWSMDQGNTNLNFSYKYFNIKQG